MKTKKLVLFLLSAILLMSCNVDVKNAKAAADSTETKDSVKNDSVQASIIIPIDEEFSLFYYEQEITFQDVTGNMDKDGFLFMSGTLEPLLAKAKKDNLVYSKIKNLDNLGIPITSPSNLIENKLVVFDKNEMYIFMDTYSPLTMERSKTKMLHHKKQLVKAWFIGVKKDAK